MQYKLGIDVGGTNTDGVLLDENMTVISSYKTPTTEDIQSGIEATIAKVLENTTVDKKDIKFAMLGTTQCTNAIVTRNGLNKVGVIRIGLPAGAAIAPMYSIPKDLTDAINAGAYQVHGGHEFNGELISPLDEDRIREIAKELKRKTNSIAITSIFSPVNDSQEIRAQEILEEELGTEGITYSLSSNIGSIGLLERENATILNASIINVAKRTTEGFQKALQSHGIDSEVYFCQNDGTLMSKEYTLKYPILTVACGPTNSLRGASFLTQQSDAIIVDIGGTTTDIGVLQNGFPRESSLSVELGGVQTNFRMPDIYSIGLGGGTIVTVNGEDFQIGPSSVGYKLVEKALVFGGDTLTVTDIAVAKGVLDLGDKDKVAHLDDAFVDTVYNAILEMISQGVERMKTSADDVPVVLCGGGSALIEGDIRGASRIDQPESGAVANAIGSAISDISGDLDRIYDISPDNRTAMIEAIKVEAIQNAINAGADPDNTVIISFEDVPLAYLPGNATRVKVKAAGALKAN